MLRLKLFEHVEGGVSLPTRPLHPLPVLMLSYCTSTCLLLLPYHTVWKAGRRKQVAQHQHKRGGGGVSPGPPYCQIFIKSTIFYCLSSSCLSMEPISRCIFQSLAQKLNGKGLSGLDTHKTFWENLSLFLQKIYSLFVPCY